MSRLIEYTSSVAPAVCSADAYAGGGQFPKEHQSDYTDGQTSLMIPAWRDVP
jgi:hypothetical protein